MSARAYTTGLLLGLALLLAVGAAINRLVDPFWYFGAPELNGFNAHKPFFARYERHVKPQLLARYRPQAIVLGNSLAEIGFDAASPDLTARGALRAYNFAFAGASWELVQCHFDFALGATEVKRAVIGISVSDLPAPRDCAGRLTEISGFSEAKLLLSLSVLDKSLRTVLQQNRARSSHTRDGRFLYARGMPGVDSRFREFLRNRNHDQKACAAGRIPKVPPQSGTIAPAAIAPARNLDLSGLRSVIREATARGIELRIVAYPQHAMFLELDLLCGRGDEHWARVGAIAQVIAEEAPRGNVELWDFLGFNEVTGETIAGRAPVYWQDPEHFNYEVGNVMLADMFGGVAHGRLGRRIAAGEANDAYHEFLTGRDAFIAQHPGFYEDLRALLAPVR